MSISLIKGASFTGTVKTGAANELVSYGGPGFVCNSNSASAASDPDDVYEILTASSTVAAIPVTSGSYLFLTHQWHSDDVADVINQAPVVRVFGHLPSPNFVGLRFPQDVSSVFPDVRASTYNLANVANLGGLWKPLTKPGYTLGTPTLTLSGIGCRHLFDTDSDQYVVSEEQYVFLGGCDFAIVVIDTAATWQTGSGTRTGMIVGQIGG